MYRMEVELEEKLRNTFRKMKGNPVASLYVQVLDSWGYYECNGDSFFFNLQNRGGLFSINDDTYHFKSVETSGVAKGTAGEYL